MSKFPELSEQGNQDALHLVERFKSKLQTVAEEMIGELYCNLIPHIETDAWTNYREECRLALQKEYCQSETASSEQAWAFYVRKAIFVQFREELEKGIIADQVKEIARLREMLNERRY
jgi:hypothetical protein